MDRVIGIQSHNKEDLNRIINQPLRKGKYKIIKESKPRWFTGKWKTTYTIKRR